MKKILIADDEERIRILVTDFLEKEGYQVLEAADGGSALTLFEEENDIDLAILDVMMPVMDGWEVCKQIRNRSKLPIIMLTAKNQEYDELYGFDIGADEYVRKPFSPSILVARVNALLRRSSPAIPVIQWGQLTIDDHCHEVRLNEELLELSPKEYELLLFLVQNKGKVFNRDQLLNHIWGYEYEGGYRTVDTHINRLRIKLDSYSTCIKTVRGFGYKFEVAP